MINGAHHVSFSTSDIERFLSFYRDLLGLPVVVEARFAPGNTAFETATRLESVCARAAMLNAGNILVEVFAYENPMPSKNAPLLPCDIGVRHLCLDVTGIDAEYERLCAAGVTFLSQPQTMPDVGVRAVYGRDPDGNIFELQELLPGSPITRSHVHR